MIMCIGCSRPECQRMHHAGIWDVQAQIMCGLQALRRGKELYQIHQAKWVWSNMVFIYSMAWITGPDWNLKIIKSLTGFMTKLIGSEINSQCTNYVTLLSIFPLASLGSINKWMKVNEYHYQTVTSATSL